MTSSLHKVLTEQAAAVVLHRTLAHSDKVYSVAFSPDGRYLVSGSVTRHLHLWDLSQDESLPTTLSGHTKFVWSASFSPDAKTIASASGDGAVFLWDVASRSYYRIMESHPSLVISLYGSAFSPDGRYLAAAGMDGEIRLWTTWNRHPSRRLSGHKGAVYSVAFSADSRFLASGGDDETVRIWDVATRQEVNVVARPGSRVTSIVFSPDGCWLAYASADHNIYISHLGNGEVKVLNGHQGLVWNIEFSPDSRFLISASDDRTVMLWEVESGLNLNVLSQHQGAVNSVAFSPDGRFAASASDDKTVLIWNLDQLKERPEAYLKLVEKGAAESVSDDDLDLLSAAQESVLDLLAKTEALLPENFLSIYRQLLDLSPNLEIEKNGGGHLYTVGGYHGLSHKGELESLLPGEYLYPESLFLHRLCNHEALYYGREGGPRKRRRLVYVLTQTGLEMSGSCDLLARCLSLTLVERLPAEAVDLRHSFIGSDLSEVLDPAAAGTGVLRLVEFQDRRPLAWLKVLEEVTARIEKWQNEYLEVETIWVLDAFAVSDWERESRDWFHRLRAVGSQTVWFVNPAPKNSQSVCRSHSLFSHCNYLSEILPQSFISGSVGEVQS